MNSGVVLNPEFLSVLACPETKAPVIQVGEWLYSTDPKTRRRYPVRNGIPVMIIEESEVVTPEEFNRVLAENGTQPFVN